MPYLPLFETVMQTVADKTGLKVKESSETHYADTNKVRFSATFGKNLVVDITVGATEVPDFIPYGDTLQRVMPCGTPGDSMSVEEFIKRSSASTATQGDLTSEKMERYKKAVKEAYETKHPNESYDAKLKISGCVVMVSEKDVKDIPELKGLKALWLSDSKCCGENDALFYTCMSHEGINGPWELPSPEVAAALFINADKFHLDPENHNFFCVEEYLDNHFVHKISVHAPEGLPKWDETQVVLCWFDKNSETTTAVTPEEMCTVRISDSGWLDIPEEYRYEVGLSTVDFMRAITPIDYLSALHFEETSPEHLRLPTVEEVRALVKYADQLGIKGKVAGGCYWTSDPGEYDDLEKCVDIESGKVIQFHRTELHNLMLVKKRRLTKAEEDGLS